MNRSRMKKFLSRIKNLLKPTDNVPAEIRRARQLVSAIDAGGIPLDPAIIVRVAESLGLGVSKKARMEKTFERIRAAIQRY